MNLENKIALITGASSGIGYATALALAKEGAQLVVHYRSNKAGITKLTDQLEKMGTKYFVARADLSYKEQIHRMFEEIQQAYSSIDILINNAGGSDYYENVLDYDLWLKVIKSNLLSAITCTDLSIPMMQGGGKIINISSLYGEHKYGTDDTIAYAAAKSGLHSFTYNLAKMLAPKILVNGIAPGYVKTPTWGDMTEDVESTYGSQQLINRFIKPEEVADMALAILKNDAMCGEIVILDGGLSLKRVL